MFAEISAIAESTMRSDRLFHGRFPENWRVACSLLSIKGDENVCGCSENPRRRSSPVDTILSSIKQMPHTGFKHCGCSINACCGECLREEQRLHSVILWSTTVVVALFPLVVVALLTL